LGTTISGIEVAEMERWPLKLMGRGVRTAPLESTNIATTSTQYPSQRGQDDPILRTGAYVAGAKHKGGMVVVD
jgi:hypothetical protein